MINQREYECEKKGLKRTDDDELLKKNNKYMT